MSEMAKSASLASLSALRAAEELLNSDHAFGKTFVAVTSGTGREGSVLVAAVGHRADELRALIDEWGGAAQELPDKWKSWWFEDASQDPEA